MLHNFPPPLLLRIRDVNDAASQLEADFSKLCKDLHCKECCAIQSLWDVNYIGHRSSPNP